jgi:hypothetical protein
MTYNSPSRVFCIVQHHTGGFFKLEALFLSMDPSERDLAREYERQRQKLDLLAQELQIQRDENAIDLNKREEKQLQDDIRAITCKLQRLDTQRPPNRKSIWRWTSYFNPRIAKKKLKGLDSESQLNKQLADLSNSQQKLSIISKDIQELENANFGAKSKLETAKTAYRSRWSEEEECCKTQSKTLSSILDQLANSNAEASAAKEELKKLKDLLEKCQEEKEKYAKDLGIAEMELQTANQQNEEHSKDFKAIGTKLRHAYLNIQNMPSEDGLRKQRVSESQQPTGNTGPQTVAPSTPSMPSTPSLTSKFREEITYVMELISNLAQGVESRRDTVFKALKETERRLEDSNRAVREYKEKVEQMLPIYEVGLDTRHRKYELDMKDIKDSRPNWDLVHRGNEAAHNGRALADATMFQDFCTGARPHRYPGEFEDQYNKVPAKIVWKHKDFTMFHNMLSWHMDMRQFGPGYKKQRFQKEFDFLFSKIYPSFEVASNQAIEKDPQLSAAYNNLWLDHADANRQFKTNRRARRGS